MVTTIQGSVQMGEVIFQEGKNTKCEDRRGERDRNKEDEEKYRTKENDRRAKGERGEKKMIWINGTVIDYLRTKRWISSAYWLDKWTHMQKPGKTGLGVGKEQIVHAEKVTIVAASP